MPEEVTMGQELPWYAKCSLDDVRCFIGANLKSVARSVVAVGYYLKQVRDRELWKDAEGVNYASVWDFASREFGISKSTASRYMSINDRFSEGGDSPLIMEKYADLSRSQLQEMLYLTDQQAETVTHETTVQQIRAMRIPEPGPVEVLEGQMSIEDFDILPPPAEPDSLASGSIVQEAAVDARYTAMSDPVEPVVVTVDDLLQDDEQEAAVAISQHEDTEQAPENDHIDEMRLIDANKLIECEFKNPISYAALCNLVKRQPTVNAVPIKHGRWIDDGLYSDNFPHHAWHCSECEESVIEIDEPWFKFCPYCGADMRKDGDGV